MITKYVFLSADGTRTVNFPPFVTQEILEICDVTHYPNNDPEDPSEGEIVFTIRIKECSEEE